MKINQRLLELRSEFERGQQQMEALNLRRTELTETLLRIRGAIQVLDELLQEPDKNGAGAEGEQEIDSTRIASVPA